MTHFYGRGFYVFLFEFKADRDLIFRSGLYFFSNKGMYLNRWTLDFEPKSDIPYVVPVWVRMLHLPRGGRCGGDPVGSERTC